jgi:hypothetical protein
VLPIGTIIAPLPDENLGVREPHFIQNEFPKVFGGSIRYSFTLSLPETQKKFSECTNKFDAKAVPVTFRQREHWHIPKNSYGPAISQATFPHKHFPFNLL